MLPDLFYTALLCVLLLLLAERRLLLAALMLLPLAIARESTLLTLVCFLLAGWRRISVPVALIAVASTLVGLNIAKHLSATALGNTEHLSPMVYLALKSPWNILRNVFGVQLWADRYPFCGVPQWTRSLSLGPVHRIGYCGFSPEGPVQVLGFALGSFGLLPLLLFKLRRAVMGAFKATPEPGQMLLRFCLVYGLISFPLTPLLGETFQRLYAYSWPLFLVAVPILLARTGANLLTVRGAVLFLGLHLIASWAELRLIDLPQLTVEVVAYLLGWQVLRSFWYAGKAAGGEPIAATAPSRNAAAGGTLVPLPDAPV